MRLHPLCSCSACCTWLAAPAGVIPAVCAMDGTHWTPAAAVFLEVLLLELQSIHSSSPPMPSLHAHPAASSCCGAPSWIQSTGQPSAAAAPGSSPCRCCCQRELPALPSASTAANCCAAYFESLPVPLRPVLLTPLTPPATARHTPLQACSAALMLLCGGWVEGQLDAGNAAAVTSRFFLLVLLAATQDIAVDGWALTLLSKEHVG